jgi:hypothetical protein
MSKKFHLKDPGCSAPSTSIDSQSRDRINWTLCVICQQDCNETLTDPMMSKRKDAGSAYKLLAESLLKMNKLNELPRDVQIQKLDEGEGLEAAMVQNKARWHQSCRLAYNKTKVQRAEKRAEKKSNDQSDDNTSAGPSKRTRGHTTSIEKPAWETVCFFCYKPGDTDSLHEVATFQVDSRVRECAELLEDTDLIARLSAGNMVALEAKYHAKCLVSLYNRARKHQSRMPDTNKEKVLSGIAFAEVVMYIEEARLDDNIAPGFICNEAEGFL